MFRTDVYLRFIPNSSRHPILSPGKASRFLKGGIGRGLVNARDVAAILGAVAWPIVVMATVLLLLKPIRTLMDQLANSLKIKVLKFKVFEAEAELTVEEAKGVLEGV